MNCPFCDLLVMNTYRHVMESHRGMMSYHPIATWNCVCGVECKSVASCEAHWSVLTREQVADHILQLKLGGGCG